MIESWVDAVPAALVGGLLVGSTIVWQIIVWRRLAGQPILERWPGEPLQLPRTAVLAVVLWMAFLMTNRLLASDTKPEALSLFAIQFMCAINLLIFAFLPLALSEGGRRSPRALGLSLGAPKEQLILGIGAFLAAVWPTGVLLAVSQLWRSVETQHAYLKALRDEPDLQLIAWIAFSAVVAAPLAEELLFRVTLQGWLGERLSGPAAIGATAIVFALVHGWRDAIPLIPLAVILGYVFQQTRSYWSCVITHALFNAVFLTLTLTATK